VVVYEKAGAAWGLGRGSPVPSEVRRGCVCGGRGKLRREAVVGEVNWHSVRRSRVTSGVVPGVERGREGRIGETTSNVSVFARSEHRGELFGKDRLGHVFEPYGSCVLHLKFCASGSEIARTRVTVVGVRVRCQLSVKISERHDVPIVVVVRLAWTLHRCC
jgi:hypothetical protein